MVYVDQLRDFGWKLRGQWITSCHLFTDPGNEDELHELAARIGMKREWLQHSRMGIPHYDLTLNKREQALKAGAQAVSTRFMVEMMQRYRKAAANAE